MRQGSVGTFFTNLRWGAFWGGMIGLAFTVFTSPFFFLRGSQLSQRYHVTFLGVAALYLLGGIGAGLFLGALRPLAKWRWGAAIIGVVAAVPLAVGGRIIDVGLKPWDREDTIVTAIYCVSFGAAVGWIYWGTFRETGR